MWDSPKCHKLFCNIHPTTLCLLSQMGQYNIGEEKSKSQAMCIFLLPVLMAGFSITMCYYHVNIMYVYADRIVDTFTPVFVGWPIIQKVVYWKLLVISELTQLASTLYSALTCIIMIEIYICVSALHKDLLAICTKQHVSQFELQIWRRKYRCLENIMRSVNGYLGGRVLVLLTLGVTNLILATYHIVGKGIVEPDLVLPFCNMVFLMACLTLPSAALSGMVSNTIKYEARLEICIFWFSSGSKKYTYANPKVYKQCIF